MKTLLLYLLAGVLSVLSANTTITDTVRYSNNTLATCTFTIYGPINTAGAAISATRISDGSSVSPATYNYNVVLGALSLTLVPNDDLTPAGTTYRVTRACRPPGPGVIVEYWSVPTSASPVTISQVLVTSSSIALPTILYSQIRGLTAGDFVYANTSGYLTRLAKPSDGTYGVRFLSGVPSWIVGGAGGGATIDSVTNLIKGDGFGNGVDSGIDPTNVATNASNFTNAALVVANGNHTLASLALGTGNQLLGMNNGATAHEYKSLAVGTSGSDFAIAYSANTVTFNLPNASGSNRGALTSVDWTTFNSKASTGSPLSQFSATTSAQLAGVISDETGSGAAVFGTSPTITTPTIASFTNAQHDHSNAAGGGQIAYSSITGTPTLRYQTVQDEGSGLTQRATINFTGAGVSCVDNSGSSRTDCTISGGGGGGGATIDSTTNLIKGDGAGNGVDTKVAVTSPTTAATMAFSVDNATLTFQGTGTVVNRDSTDTLTNKTLTQPTIADFTNATHTHANTATGGPIAYSNITGTPTLYNQTIQDEASGLTQRATVNFTGAGVTCVDNAGSTRTDCTIPSWGTGNAASYTTVSFSATPTFTCGSATAGTVDVFKLTLTGNVTSATLTGCTTGQAITLVICQDGTGSRTYAGPTTVKNFPTINSTANYCTSASGRYDGTNLVMGAASVYKDDYSDIAGQIVLPDGSGGKTTINPSTGTVTITLPASTGTLALIGDPLSQFAATTSAQLAGVISDETGSGALVFGTSPSLTTPTIGSFTNAQHDHSNAAGGGQIAYSNITGTPTIYNQTIQDEGSGLTQRSTLNFTGGGVSCADDTTRTTCTIAGGGGGDFSSNTATSVDSEFVLFSGTGGKTGKRATGTGIARAASGVFSASEISGDCTTSGSNAITCTKTNGTDLSFFSTATGANNAQTATYQVLAADFTNLKTITVASGTFTITLVDTASQPANGKYIDVVNYGSGVVTIARSGQNINGGTSSLTLPAASATAPSSARVWSDGTNYFAELGQVPASTTCTNQFVRAVNGTAAATCASVSNADISNSTIDLTAKVTGILPAANGGTGNGFTAFSGPASSTKTFTLPNASATVLTDNALVTSAQGGTGNGFTKFSGPATSEKTFTLPNASAAILTDNAAVTVAQGGTGLSTLTAHALYAGNGTSAPTAIGPDASTTKALFSAGSSADPAFRAIAVGDLPAVAREFWFPSAGCNNATAGEAWDLPTSNAPTATCYGTSYRFGALDYADSANTTATFHFRIPTGFTGNVDFAARAFLNATSQSVKLTVATVCIATSEDMLNPTFNSAQTVTTTSPGTANQQFEFAQTSMTMTGCAADELLVVKVGRDTTDTSTTTFSVVGVKLTFRITPQA